MKIIDIIPFLTGALANGDCSVARCSDMCYWEGATALCACPIGEFLLYGRATTCGVPNQLCDDYGCSDTCSSMGAAVASCGCSVEGEALDEDGKTCVANPQLAYIAICQSKNCDGGCYVSGGVAVCTCPEGQIHANEDQSGTSCIPDPCLSAGCDGGCVYQGAHTAYGVPTCSCSEGYRLDSRDGTTCLENHTCESLGCSHTCNRQTDTCTCPGGLVLASNGLDCVDTSTAICDGHECDHFCYADNGEQKCDCNTGYVLFIDGKRCFEDVCYGMGCSHTCDKNMWNVAECTCPDNMVIGSDGKTCEWYTRRRKRSNALCDGHGCSTACYEDNGVATCACPDGEDLDVDDKTCIPSADDDVAFTPPTNYVHPDKTIRPFSSQGGCIHKRYNGFNAGDKIAYKTVCDASNNKNQWEYMEDTKQIKSVGAISKGKELCMEVKNTASKKMNLVKLENCDPSEEAQQFVMKEGEIRLAVNEEVCLMVPAADDNEWIRTRGCNWKSSFMTFEST